MSILGEKHFLILQAAVGTVTTSAKVSLEITLPWDIHKAFYREAEFLELVLGICIHDACPRIFIADLL